MTEKSCLIGKYRKILNCCNFGIKWTYISLSCWKRVPLKMSNNSSRKFICSPVHSGKPLEAMGSAVKSQIALEATNPNMFFYSELIKPHSCNSDDLTQFWTSTALFPTVPCWLLSISKAIIQILLDFYQKHFSRLNQQSQQQMKKIWYSMFVWRQWLFIYLALYKEKLRMRKPFSYTACVLQFLFSFFYINWQCQVVFFHSDSRPRC